jgi:hypothetical protein
MKHKSITCFFRSCTMCCWMPKFKINTVTYSRVLFTMDLYYNPKIQHTTVNYNQHLSEHTYTSNLYGLGTLTPIEFVQQDLLWSLSNTNWPSKPIQSRRQQNSLLWKSITACLHCCVTMELRPSSIVASLRRRKNLVLLNCYVTGHRCHIATKP